MKTNDRMIRGYSILAKGDTPISINKETFLIPSQSSNKKYKVTHKQEWGCTCPDFKYRKVECKHIKAVKMWVRLRQKIESEDTLELENELRNQSVCIYCGSDNIKKNGKRKTEQGLKQRYRCKKCNKTFIEDKELNKFKANPKIVVLTVDLYYKGLSLRNITDTIHQFYGIKLHHETVRRWIVRFTKLMNDYVEKLKPKVSEEIWQIDDQAIKSKGKIKWSWNIIDPKTRFLIATQITESRYIKDARIVLKKAKMVAGTVPKAMISDGLPAYPEAIEREYNRTPDPKKVEHVKIVSIRHGQLNTNKVERFQGTFRDRDKVMRGFKGGEQSYSDGFRTYYNFIRPHQALDGKTPSEVAGIDLRFDRNRWLSLIRQSLK